MIRFAILLSRGVVAAFTGLLIAGGTLTIAADRVAPQRPTLVPVTASPKTLVVPQVTGQAYVFAKGILQDGGFAWRVSGPCRGSPATPSSTRSRRRLCRGRHRRAHDHADPGAEQGFAERGGPDNRSLCRNQGPAAVELAGVVDRSGAAASVRISRWPSPRSVCAAPRPRRRSFLNVVAARLPERRSLLHPRSACGACATPIAWYDNVPLLSYARPPWALPELPGADQPDVSGRRAGDGGASRRRASSPSAYAATAAAAVFCAALVVVTATDLTHRIVPTGSSCRLRRGGRADDGGRAEPGVGDRRLGAAAFLLASRSPTRAAWAWATSSSRC
jgi:hypothetical protein